MDLQTASGSLPLLRVMSKYYAPTWSSSAATATCTFGPHNVYRLFKRSDNYTVVRLTFYKSGLQFAQVFDEGISDNWSLHMHLKRFTNIKIRKLLEGFGFLYKSGECNYLPLMGAEDFSIFLDKLIPLIPRTRGGATKPQEISTSDHV